MTQPKIIVPRHALDEWTRCHRKWYYSQKLGLEPKSLPENMVIGNMVHKRAAAGYAHQAKGGEFLEAALTQEFDADEGETLELVMLANDMVEYWWENQGKQQLYAEVVATEETFYLEAGPYLIPWTADLIARRPTGELVIVDHKTVGNVRDAVAFLPIDFQMRRYAAGGFQKFGEVQIGRAHV